MLFQLVFIQSFEFYSQINKLGTTDFEDNKLDLKK